MSFINRDDIERWGITYEAKGDFPRLISKLVLATTPKSTRVRFPAGSSVFLNGWDGEVICEEESNYIPKGLSYFELGTERESGKKIKADYKNRTGNPLGCEPKETTLILITPFTWKDKDSWIKEKNEENFWKDVRVYDAIDLEKWLEISIVVSRWFSLKVNKNISGVNLSAEECWEEWSYSPQITLTPQIVVTGREKEKEQLLKILMGEACIKGIRASTRKEAIAFIIACGKLFSEEESERFFSKTLVIDNVNDFRLFSRQINLPLNLIANIDNYDPLYSAVGRGHHVFIPLCAQDEFHQEVIDLPILDRDGLINILIDLGINETVAKSHVYESGRNITILRKFLGFPGSSNDQNQKKNVREIIPILLLGRWNEDFEGDIELLEKLSDQKYSDYSAILNKWDNIDDSPLIHIGNIWRLTSPLDLWANLSKYIVNSDLNILKECFKTTFFNGNPNIDSTEEVLFSSFFKRKKYSNFSREGLLQSLILVGLRGDSLQIPHSQQWVDDIISDLLFDVSAELWISVNYELPLIAEASPKSFLKAVSNSLEKEPSEIVDMFEEEKGLFDSIYHYTGLLWALEGLAWHPEYLMLSAMILIKLDRVIPELKLVNSPMNSLVEIFKPWHYQTLAVYEERMEVLKQITAKEKESGWKLLIKLLPQGHEIAYSTHKTRWRIFDQNTNINYTNKEVYDTHRFIVEILINLFDGSENKLSELIDNSVLFSYQEDRLKVYDWADKVCDNIEQKDYKPWYTIREILHHHRSYPDSEWSLPESELQRLEEIYHKLEPSDIVEKHKWLFDRFWPAYIQGMKKSDPDLLEYRKNNDVRVTAVKKWINELGLEKTVSLRDELKEPMLLAEALADIIVNENDLIFICECFKCDSDDIKFSQAFIRNKSCKENFDWVKNLVLLLLQNGFDNDSLSNLLVSIQSHKEIYNYIETLDQELQNAYWTNETAYYGFSSIDDAIYVINKLGHYKRYFTALKVTKSVVKELPAGLIMSVLYKATSEESSEPVSFDRHDLSNIFAELYKKKDLDQSLMIKIEWQYIFLFDRYFPLKPKYLENELASNPEFFIEVIKWLYFPNDSDRYYEGKEGVPEDKIKIIARQSKILLDSWNKVPGMRYDRSINVVELNNWIKETRKLAKECDRLEVSDIEIGTLLSRLPEDDNQLPSEVIFHILEEVNSKDLYESYSMGLTNKRGSTVRMPFDGGQIERDHAMYFGDLAKRYRNKYPNVSEIFKNIEQNYLIEADQEDKKAKLEGLEY